MTGTVVTDERDPDGNVDPNENALEVAETEEYPVDRLKDKVNESLGKRPLTVYLVLFAGAATLLLLLGVVWISSRSGDDSQELICTEIDPADARTAILTGQVARINVLVDNEDPTQTLTGIQLRFEDGTCRQTPQGAGMRESLFSVIGAVALYNNYGEGGIEIHYQSQNIEPELLATSTSTSEPTAPPTETSIPPTETSTEIPPTETATPSPTSSPSPFFLLTPTTARVSSATSDQSARVGDPGT